MSYLSNELTLGGAPSVDVVNVIGKIAEKTAYCVPEIKDVIYNPPATIIRWEDGTKTVVRNMEGQIYDPELGFLYCIAKKAYGDDFKKTLKKWCWRNEKAPEVKRTNYYNEEGKLMLTAIDHTSIDKYV